jgi:preprotein translocase subunit SecA
MAGRGTDILLGGNPDYLTRERLRKNNKDRETIAPAEWEAEFNAVKTQTDQEHDEVVRLGGLYIVGTERHESRRIDNQLRGRAGRQGDPGSARFFLSLQDDLMRIFGGQGMQNLMLRLGMEEDVPIESKMISKRIAAAQKAVEAQNFAARKHVLEYDDVMNKQRQAVYGMRRKLIEGQDQKENLTEIITGILNSYVDLRLPEKAPRGAWDWPALESDILTQFGVQIDRAKLEGMDRRELEGVIHDQLMRRYQEKEDLISAPLLRETERMIMLNVIDNQWKDHLLSMDHLKEGIGLRGYAQKDPLVEYKKESYILFQDMMDRIEDETVKYLFFLQRAEARSPDANVPYPELWADEEDEGGEPVEALATVSEQQRAAEAKAAQTSVLDFTKNIQRKKDKELEAIQFIGGGAPVAQQPVLNKKKVGRNEPCPCGSGKKYKQCHGA